MNGALVGIGIDSVDIPRFAEILARRPGLAARLFTPGEQRYAAGLANPVPTLAARFAAKEAVMKALGVGLGAFGWADVEVVRRLRAAHPTWWSPAGPPRWPSRRGVGSLACVDHPHRDGGLGRGGGRRRDPRPDPGRDGRGGPAGRRAGGGADRAGRLRRGRRGPPDARGRLRAPGGGGRRPGNNGADGRAAARLLARSGCGGVGAGGGRRSRWASRLPRQPTWSSTPPTAPG